MANDAAKKPKKIGLALGGGGAKGLAHIGIIKALEEAEINIDFIAGTSMGALIGAWYALTRDIYSIERAFLKLKPRDFLPLIGGFGKSRSLFRDDAIEKALRSHLGGVSFGEMKIPFRAVATDIKNGDTVVLSKGSVADAVRASIALPIVFSPETLDGKMLIDGGFSDPVPADVARDMGADIVIAADVSSRWIGVTDEMLKKKNIYSIVSSSLSIIEYQIAKDVLKHADVVLRPPVLSYDWTAFSRAEEIIAAGEREARTHLKEIRGKAGIPEPEKTPLEKLFDFLSGAG